MSGPKHFQTHNAIFTLFRKTSSLTFPIKKKSFKVQTTLKFREHGLAKVEMSSRSMHLTVTNKP